MSKKTITSDPCNLRPYQLDFISQLRNKLREVKDTTITMPLGSGKGKAFTLLQHELNRDKHTI